MRSKKMSLLTIKTTYDMQRDIFKNENLEIKRRYILHTIHSICLLGALKHRLNKSYSKLVKRIDFSHAYIHTHTHTLRKNECQTIAMAAKKRHCH